MITLEEEEEEEKKKKKKKVMMMMIIIIIWIKVKATPNMPLGTKRGNRGITLTKPDLNATWLKISGGNHRKKFKRT